MRLLHANIVGEGQPFIILHGFLGMSDNWKTLGKRFSEQGYQIHMLDQRNHGRSFHDDFFNYEIMVEDVYHYCNTNNLSDIVLLGHSMGGKTAMFFAATYPELVSRLIVADIAPRFYPRHHEHILNGLHALRFDKITNRQEAEEILSTYVTHDDTRQFLLKNLYWKEKGKLGLRINLEVLTDQVEEVGEALPLYMGFDGKVLFLRGDRSEYISKEDEKGIMLQFPRARIESIENAGHWLHAENPIAFFDSVVRFLS